MLAQDEIIFQAELYHLMAQLLRFPDDALETCVGNLAEMFSDDSEEFAILQSMKNDLCERQTNSNWLLDLEIDYTALFIGAFKMLACPYASYYLDGENRLGGKSTVAIESIYCDYGLILNKSPKQPGDHLATMLEFLFVLLREDLNDESKNLNEAAMFFRTYIEPWIKTFSQKIVDHAETDFYVLLGRLIPLVLLEDSLISDLSTVHVKNENPLAS